MAIADVRTVSTPQHDPGSGRDTGIDLVRALCVLGVIIVHGMMVGVSVTDDGPLFANASEGSAWIIPFSWAMQVMPLFFVIGGFAGYTAFLRMGRRGGTSADFVAARIHRLLLPAVVTVAVIGAGLAALLLHGVPDELVAIAGYRFGQPLWFLGVFLLCQALLPALVAAHERAPWLTAGLLVLAATAVDAARISTGMELIGFLNLGFVWLALQQLGFFLADGRVRSLARRTRMGIGLTAVAGLVLSFALGIHSPDLIANINPPTTALLLVGVAHTMLMSLMRDRLNAWSQSALGARVRSFVTPRAMTIYLWHMPVLLAMAGASAVFAIMTGIALPEPNTFAWFATRPLWLAIAFVLVAGVVMVVARVEARPAPASTGSTTRLAVASVIGIAAVSGLLVLGATPLTTLLAAVMMIAALRLARARRHTASDDRLLAQPGSAP